MSQRPAKLTLFYHIRKLTRSGNATPIGRYHRYILSYQVSLASIDPIFLWPTLKKVAGRRDKKTIIRANLISGLLEYGMNASQCWGFVCLGLVQKVHSIIKMNSVMLRTQYRVRIRQRCSLVFCIFWTRFSIS